MKLRKFTYWCCRQEDDAECYNIRAKTRKEANRQRAMQTDPNRFTKPFKVLVRFKDTFDLIDQALREGSLYEYPS